MSQTGQLFRRPGRSRLVERVVRLDRRVKAVTIPEETLLNLIRVPLDRLPGRIENQITTAEQFQPVTTGGVANVAVEGLGHTMHAGPKVGLDVIFGECAERVQDVPRRVEIVSHVVKARPFVGAIKHNRHIMDERRNRHPRTQLEVRQLNEFTNLEARCSHSQSMLASGAS